MKEATCLYHPDGSEEVWGEKLGVIVVDADEVDKKLKKGWFTHPDDAIAAKAPKVAKAPKEK